jgi:hypothetical protein
MRTKRKRKQRLLVQSKENWSIASWIAPGGPHAGPVVIGL